MGQRFDGHALVDGFGPIRIVIDDIDDPHWESERLSADVVGQTVEVHTVTLIGAGELDGWFAHASHRTDHHSRTSTWLRGIEAFREQ